MKLSVSLFRITLLTISFISLSAYASPKELCYANSDCSFGDVGHGSGRNLVFSGFSKGHTYTCTYHNAACSESATLDQFKLENLASSNPSQMQVHYINNDATVKDGNGFKVNASSSSVNGLQVNGQIKNYNPLGTTCNAVISCAQDN